MSLSFRPVPFSTVETRHGPAGPHQPSSFTLVAHLRAGSTRGDWLPASGRIEPGVGAARQGALRVNYNVRYALPGQGVNVTELRAVFFDVGNTLLFPNHARILAPLEPRKVASSRACWHEIERATKKKFDDLIERGGLIDHGFWFLFYSQLLEGLGVEDNAIRDSLVEATRISANWCDIRPGTREALQRIGKGYPLGVISNADGRIARVLERCGIADCFQSITDSGEVGYEKPNPAIFEAALRSIGVAAGHSLYVGDVYSVDYLGATRAGMKAILFDVSGAYQGRNLPRVQSLEELEAILGSRQGFDPEKRF